MSRVDDAVDSRLREIQDIATAGWSELTGKVQRIGHGQYGEFGRRFGGGFQKAFPELKGLKWGPGQIAAAIERRSGKIYRTVRDAVRVEMLKYVSEPRKRTEKPTVPAHEKLTAKCVTCGKMHGKGQHRFHGPGSFHSTHAFSFNPKLSEEMPKLSEEMPMIYGRVLRVSAQKTQPHRCDAECKNKYNHCYRHDFTSSTAQYGLPAGCVLVLPSGQRVRLAAKSLLLTAPLRGKR